MFKHFKSNFSRISILSIIALIASGILVIEATTIKVFDRKITDQHYNYYNSTYEWNEVKGNMNWEDGIVSINPDYEQLLQRDLDVITTQLDYINEVDLSNNLVETDKYRVKICLEDQNVIIKDSTIMKKLVKSEISAFLELYDKETDQFLYKKTDRRFVIENKLLSYGFAHDQFLTNKAFELTYVDIFERVPDFIEAYEIPIIRRKKLQSVYSLVKLFYPNSISPKETDIKIASVVLSEE